MPYGVAVRIAQIAAFLAGANSVRGLMEKCGQVVERLDGRVAHAYLQAEQLGGAHDAHAAL
jgi:hypothetical protein